MGTTTIRPDAPGHPDNAFKVFANGIKVATLTKKQVLALSRGSTATLTRFQEAVCEKLTEEQVIAALKEDEDEQFLQYQGH